MEQTGSRTSYLYGFATTRKTDTIDVGGRGFAQDKKYRDVQQNPRVAVVIDDVESVDPWRPRMIEIRGLAEVIETGGAHREHADAHFGQPELLMEFHRLAHLRVVRFLIEMLKDRPARLSGARA